MTTGRNHPCPCGSGKKYKRCCLPTDEATRSEELRHALPERQTRRGPLFVVDDCDDDLDQVSNAVVDLIDQGKLDQAEAAAHDLLERYPEVIDGLERLAMVYEARGRSKDAADYYRKAIAVIEENPDGFDPESIAYYRDRVAEFDPPASN